MNEFINLLERVGFNKKSENQFIKTKVLTSDKRVKSIVTFKLKILKNTIKLHVSIENEHELVNNVPVYQAVIWNAVNYAHQFDSFITSQYEKLLKK